MTSPAWSAFRAKAKRSPEADTYEPLEADTWFSLEIFAPPKSPKALLFFTKPFLCKEWLQLGMYPDRLFTMVRYGIPSMEYWRLIRDVARRTRLPLCFIGDLDPMDLTTFLVLRSGDPDLRRPSRQMLPITYVGFDDSWLKLCEKHARRKGDAPYFRMTSLELEHRDLVLQMAPWLLDLVGPRCADYLRSGMKVELEGASNPHSYKEGFLPVLRDHLLRRAHLRPVRGEGTAKQSK